jgi:hypothetical protein
MLSDIKGVVREFTWDEARAACEAEGGGLAKIEDTETNQFVNSALGGGAYSIQWIGGKCTKFNGAYRYRWTKDNELVAASYTNFPIDYATGLEQEINPCNMKNADNPTESSNMCMSTAGVGYYYQWRTGPCGSKLGDAICEKIPNGGSDDTPTTAPTTPPTTPGANKKKKKSKGGAIAAGILVPIIIIAAGFFGYKKYAGDQGGGFGTQKFITTSYAPADDGTAFNSPLPQTTVGGAASL